MKNITAIRKTSLKHSSYTAFYYFIYYGLLVPTQAYWKVSFYEQIKDNVFNLRCKTDNQFGKYKYIVKAKNAEDFVKTVYVSKLYK